MSAKLICYETNFGQLLTVGNLRYPANVGQAAAQIWHVNFCNQPIQSSHSQDNHNLLLFIMCAIERCLCNFPPKLSYGIHIFWNL